MLVNRPLLNRLSFTTAVLWLCGLLMIAGLGGRKPRARPLLPSTVRGLPLAQAKLACQLGSYAIDGCTWVRHVERSVITDAPRGDPREASTTRI
jgi:hypothetical protein